MLEIRELDRLLSLFLEVMDDPSKKELLLYLLCYVQIARREGSGTIELDELLSCAYRNFRTSRSFWKDVLVELNLFKIWDLYGNVYKGKDIYKLSESGVYLMTLEGSYAQDISSFGHRVLKYWNIVNRLDGRRSLGETIKACVFAFNEELYQEAALYAELQKERVPQEASFFSLIEELCRASLTKKKEDIHNHLLKSYKLARELGDVYYEVNIRKLREDIQKGIKRLQKNQDPGKIKIEFVWKRNKRSFLSYLWEKITRWYRNWRRREPLRATRPHVSMMKDYVQGVF